MSGSPAAAEGDEGDDIPQVSHAERVKELVERWTAATKASNRETQADVVFELAELTQDDSISGEHFAQQPKVLDVLAAMLDNPPILTPARAVPNDGVRHISVQLMGNLSPAQQELQLLEAASVALSTVLADICHNSEELHSAGGTTAHIPKIGRHVFVPLAKLLDSSSEEGKKAACWILHFIAVCSPEEGLRWAADIRRKLAQGLVSCLSSNASTNEIKTAALHSLGMIMQRDVLCRADVAQAAGVPQFLRLLKSDNVELVTSAAGALHALVQGNGQKAYVPWIVQIKGLSELILVASKLPVTKKENRHALLQVLWTLECCANSDEPTAKALIDERLLPTLFSIIHSSHGVSDEAQDAAALVIAGLVGGKDNKEPRPRLRDMVITELGVPVLEDWSQQGGRALQAVADALLRHATPLHVEKSKAKEAMPKLMRPPSFVGNEAVTASIIVPDGLSLPSASTSSTPPDPRLVQSSFIAKEALVIGVGAYEHLTKVKHAIKDAQAMTALLAKASFRVLTSYDHMGEGLRTTMLQFEQRVMAGSLVVLFFSGHAAFFNGGHYLLPVDFKPPASLVQRASSSGADVAPNADVDAPLPPPAWFLPEAEAKEVKATCGALDTLMERLIQKGVRHTVVLMDACRQYRPLEDGTNQEEERGSAPGETAAAPTATQPAGTSPTKAAGAAAAKPGTKPAPGSAYAAAASPAKKVTVTTATKPAATSPAAAAGSPARKAAAKPLLGRTQTLKGGSAMVLAGLASTANSRTKATDALPWTHRGLRGSIVSWACGPGGTAFGPGKGSASSQLSLWVEWLTRFLGAKQLSLRGALEATIKSCSDTTQGAQVPGFKDDGCIGPEVRLG